MGEAGLRVLGLVLGNDVEEDARLAEVLQVLLELRVALPDRGLRAEFEVLGAVVAHHAAPERVVEVEREGLLVFAEKGLHDVRDVERDGRQRLPAHRVLVEAPVRLVVPAREAEVGRLPADVVDGESVVRARVFGKGGVEAAHEVHAPAEVRAVEVAEQAVRQIVEVVLDDRAVELLRDLLPRRAPFRDRLLHARLGRLRAKRGPVADVAHARVDEDDVGTERVQRGIAEHGVLPPLVVLALVERRADAVVEEEELQERDDVVRGRAAEDGDALLQEAGTLQQRAPERGTLARERLAVKRPPQQGPQRFVPVHAAPFI